MGDQMMPDADGSNEVPVDFVTLGMFIIGSLFPLSTVDHLSITLTSTKMTSNSAPHRRQQKMSSGAQAPTQHSAPVCFHRRRFVQLWGGLSIKALISRPF